MQYSDLKYDILATLSYFRLFQYPLSDLEIWKMLIQENKKNPQESKLLTGQATKQQNNASYEKISLFQIKEVLDELKQEGTVEEKNGFYWINSSLIAGNTRSNNDLVATRMERARISENKYKKALRIIKILKCIPFIKMIAVCNSLSYKNSRKESDIDLFIITAAGKIWTTRLMVVGLLKLMRLRPTEKNTENKICASFFISEDNMNLKKIKITSPIPSLSRRGDKMFNAASGYNFHIDIYLLYWIATLAPIYDKKEAYANFINENCWIKDWLQNWEQQKNHVRSITENKILTMPFYIISLFIPEFFARKIQMLMMPKHLKNMANIDTTVIINDSMLKFHDKDRRGEYYNSWQKLKNRALHSSPLNER